MSVSGRKLFCKVISVLQENGIENMVAIYEYSPYIPVTHGILQGGQVTVDITGLTETEINSKIQQSLCDGANLEIISMQLDPENFTLSDVRGGRI
jgi:hypothetical protein